MRNGKNTEGSSPAERRGGGRVHQAAILVGLLSLSACSEEVIIYQSSGTEDAGDPGSDSAAPANEDAGRADTKAPPQLDSSVAPDTSPPVDTGAEQLCVDTINKYRATLSLPPLQRWNANESCAASQGLADSKSGTPHSAFGKCGEWAQNECPGWPGPGQSMITGCLQMMWNEGPGQDFGKHGHYINMSSKQYTMVSCGFATTADGSTWAVQDFK